MRIDPSLLAEIKDRVPISEVIGKYVTWDRRKTNPRRGDHWACCPFHGESGPSFHCEDRKGRYFCFGCQASGDHFQFLMQADGMTFASAVREVAGLAGIRIDGADTRTEAETNQARQRWEARRMADQKAAERHRAKYVETVRGLWSECLPIKGTLADAYLSWRICPHDWPPSLRFHPAMPCPEDGLKHPCLVAAVQGPDKALVALWRIYLTAQGRNLEINGTKVKLGIGPSSGGAVRLGPVAEDWNVGEGLESTLGAWALCGFKGSFAASLSTSGMVGLLLPPAVRNLRLWSDGDKARLDKQGRLVEGLPPGQKAAVERQKAAMQSGVRCAVNEPPEGTDWADVWVDTRNRADAC